jgi:RimJ/RimL family protein N-acetyltransferase
MQRPLAPPDPPLSDGAITLRPWAVADVPALVSICNGDEEMARWLDRLPQPYTEHDAHGYVAFGLAGWRGDGIETPFAVVAADTGRPLGTIGVRWLDPPQGVAELGYWTGREARGRGAATRAVRLVADWVLGDLGCERLELRADARNTASLRVAEKAGFTREGILRSARANARDGRRVDHVLWSLLPGEVGR